MGSAAARRELMSLAAADSGVDEEVRGYALALLAAVPSSETMAWSLPVPLMLVREWEPAGA